MGHIAREEHLMQASNRSEDWKVANPILMKGELGQEADTPTQTSTDQGVPVGVIVGIVAAVVVILGVVIFVRKRKKADDDE